MLLEELASSLSGLSPCCCIAKIPFVVGAVG